MSEDVIEVRGKGTGPTSVILVGVHGDEKCGVEAMKKLLPSLVIERGRAFFCCGNPKAVEKNKRFIDADLNRMFKKESLLSEKEKRSYEYERAQFLKSYLDQAGALLDVHASSTPKSKPFVICEANAKGIIEYLPVDLVVSGFDHVEPGGTDYYMNSVGRVGICIECGQMGDSVAVDIAMESIIAFLKARGHVPNDLSVRSQSYIHMYELYLTKTNTFKLSKPFDDFEEVAKDQLIGVDGKTAVRTKIKSSILFARDRKEIGAEAFLLGEKTKDLV